MEQTIQKDYIIVGQGLAGTILAQTFLKNGKSVIVIDEPNLSKASINYAVWNAVANRVFFTSNHGSSPRKFDYELFSFNLDGTDLKQHTHLHAVCRNLAVMKGNGSVLFTLDKERNGKQSVLRLNTNTSLATEIVSHID